MPSMPSFGFPKWKTLLIVLMMILAGFGIIMFLPDMTGKIQEIGNSGTRFFMGAVGAIMFIVSLVYGAETAKKHEYAHALVYTFLGVLIGTMLILVWLYG